MTAKVLCVDDDASMLASYELLQAYQSLSPSRFHIDTASGGEQALAAIASRGPYAVLITDMDMPGMSGIQFLSRVRQLAPESVRMMLTGHADLQVAIEAVNEGNIFRFLTKPCLPDTLIKALTAGVEQHRLITAEKELLESTLAGSIKALMEVLSLVNPMAFGRASRVQRLVQQLAAALNVEKAWQVELAASLSQVGCVTVPEEILKKVYLGARLTPDEACIVDRHPRVGHDLIANIPRLEEVASMVIYQEKRFDGGGNRSDAKQGTDIPLGARILKVALDFDSLESKDLSKAEAFARLKQRSGWYDPSVLDALGWILGEEVAWEKKQIGVGELLSTLQEPEAPWVMKETRTGCLINHITRMILAEDVLSDEGALLLSKGLEITPRLLERLRNYARKVGVREPIRILVPPRGMSGVRIGARKPGQNGNRFLPSG
jgi:response regulator RpfG family c-di-GMP phosphodiesterase